jgi:hypothetical protein
MASGAAEIAAVLVRENVGAGDSRTVLATARATEVRALAESVRSQGLA